MVIVKPAAQPRPAARRAGWFLSATMSGASATKASGHTSTPGKATKYRRPVATARPYATLGWTRIFSDPAVTRAASCSSGEGGRAPSREASLGSLDDVESKGRFHQRADLAGLQGKRGVRERLYHLSPSEATERAVITLRRRIVGAIVGELREVLALSSTGEDPVRALACLVLGALQGRVGSSSPGVRDENVRCRHRLLLLRLRRGRRCRCRWSKGRSRRWTRRGRRRLGGRQRRARGWLGQIGAGTRVPREKQAR